MECILYGEYWYQHSAIERELRIAVVEDKVTSLSMKRAGVSSAPRRPRMNPPRWISKPLDKFFSGVSDKVDLGFVFPRGTEFQMKVWRALTNIPRGATKSYGEIAREVGSPKAARAVGMANHRNPIGILIPCHRVIQSDGSMGGYAGGIAMKRHLLKLEGINVSSL